MTRFSPALFDFLRELRANNDRARFQANKARSERDVKAPVLLFVEAVGPALHRGSRHVVADPRPVCAAGFMDRYVAACKTANPLMRFLAGALDLPW